MYARRRAPPRRRYRRVFKKKRAYLRRRSRYVRRRRFIRRRTSKFGTRRYRRKRRSQYKTMITRVFRADVIEMQPNSGKSVSYKNSVAFNPKVAFNQIVGNTVLTDYAQMFDKWRCVKMELKIWVNSRAPMNATTRDTAVIPDIMVAYDPDANGRTFAGFEDFYRVGAKAHFMRPYKVKTLTLYPKLGYKPGIAIPTTASKSPWMDAQQILTDAYFPNSVQYIIRDMSAANDFEGQVYYTYQFRGLRNGQTYGMKEDSVRHFDNGARRIIPVADSQNQEVLRNFEQENFEMLHFDSL